METVVNDLSMVNGLQTKFTFEKPRLSSVKL